MNITKLLLSLSLFLPLATSALSQILNDRFRFDPDLSFSSKITSPSGLLGFEPGEDNYGRIDDIPDSDP